MKKNISVFSWDLTVDLQGGRIEELSYKETLILGVFQRVDGKVGSTHVCTPNYHSEGTKEYGLPIHGAPRNVVWEVKTDDSAYLSVYCNIPATDLYKADLYVEQIFELTKDSFKQTVIVENTKGETVPVNIAIHDYWATPGGWRGTKVNGIYIESEVIKDGQCKARKSNTIVFPDKRKFKLKLQDFSDLRLWSARNGKNELNEDFVCIEPIMTLGKNYFGSKQSMLKEGKALGASQEILVA